MQSALPLDVLADELGAAAGRIERELRLKDEARAARFEARLAAIELAAFRAEEDRQRIFGERLAELRNGRDGKDGKDPDFGPVFAKFDEFAHAQNKSLDVLEGACKSVIDAKLTEIDAKLAEVKDGKDGEPGRDGKDADIEPIKKEFEEFQLEIQESFEASEEALLGRIDSKLAEIKNGKDGEPGPEGPAGKDGKLPIAREWTNRVHYEGDVVRHNGATYQALADTGSEPPSGDWGELASRGTDGIGFVLRGTYDASAEYKRHDIVMINRNSFAAKCDNPGECPGDGWQLFAPSGRRGKEGPLGGKGADGKSVSIANLEADPDAMVLRITDSLGKTFTLDLEPIAERIIEAAR